MAMTEQEIMEVMPKKPAAKLEVGAANTISVLTTRKLLLVGCGDGGCNIAADIAARIPNEVHFIAYNTSTRGMANIDADKLILPRDEDGAGKVREFSKDVFKKNSYKILLDSVINAVNNEGEFAYIIVCTTTDGGTGSGISPMTAKLINDNVELPVIVLGVYPSKNEDPTAQFNALQWQTEMNKVGVPYFVLDNDKPDTDNVVDAHEAVNSYAATLMSLLAGKEFGNSDISMIDNRNLYMLLAHVGDGGRIVGAVSTNRLASAQTLDDYVDQMLQKNLQPLPSDCRGIGVFVKGPNELISKVDTSMSGLQAKYGTAMIKFAHIEESEETKIAILMTGCTEASGRLTEIKNRYDDAMMAQTKRTSVLSDLLSDATNPMGAVAGKSIGDEANLDALEL